MDIPDWLKVVILDSFSRHNLWGDAHLVLRDILPDKDFDQWLAVCVNKEVSLSFIMRERTMP